MEITEQVRERNDRIKIPAPRCGVFLFRQVCASRIDHDMLHPRAKARGIRNHGIKGIIFSIFFLLICHTGVNAKIFDKTGGSAEQIVSGIFAHELNKMDVRINDKKVELKRFNTRRPTKEVLDAYLQEAEGKGYKLENNAYLFYAARALFGTGNCGENPENFGFIFFKNKSGAATFAVAGACNDTTEIIRIKTEGNMGKKPFKGFDDGIKHLDGAEKVLSIEILSGEAVVNYANFYKVDFGARQEVRNYYKDVLGKNGWQIIRKEYTEKSDLFFAKKSNKEVMLMIIEDEKGEKTIIVFG